MTTDQHLYVLAERVANMQEDVSTIVRKVDGIIDTVNHLDDVERRVSVLEDWQTWVQRIVLGTLLTAIVSACLAVSQIIH